MQQPGALLAQERPVDRRSQPLDELRGHPGPSEVRPPPIDRPSQNWRDSDSALSMLDSAPRSPTNIDW